MWAVVDHHGSIHVIPVNDNKDHSFEKCECGMKYNDGVYVHNSFDGREAFEEIDSERKIYS